MKTIKDIVAAIDALPVTAFKDTYGSSGEINQALRRGWDRWMESSERVLHKNLEEKAREERQEKDAERARQRAANVKQWLKDGTLKQGVFIKVSGARDGLGIREFIGARERVIVCRQWQTSSWKRRLDKDAKLVKKGKEVWLGGSELMPSDQITTHEYDKVVKILG
jgi:hypothetical protein